MDCKKDYDKYPSESDFIRYLPLDELLEKSDIVSLHCPLTEETHHLINASSIARMKKGVVVINTSRGALIDAEAAGGIPLRIDIRQQHALAFRAHARRKVHGGGGLPHPALLVQDRNGFCHGNSPSFTLCG